MSLLDTPLTTLLSHALDLTSTRQAQVSQNIANIDTPGYRTRDIDFRTELRRALAGIEPADISPAAREVPGLVERPDGNNVSIDREGLASARMDQKKAAKLAVAIESAFEQLGAFDAKSAAYGTNSSERSGSVQGGTPAALARLFSGAPGSIEADDQPVDFDAIRIELEKALAPEIERQEAALRKHPDGLVISLREIGFFDSGSATIKPNAEDAFARITQVLRRHDCAIRIEGHTDIVPIHTTVFSSNWELSTARATEIVKLLIEKYSFAADRLSAAGYAQFRPVADNSDPQGRQLNRRVDVVILAPTTLKPTAELRSPSSRSPTKNQDRTKEGGTISEQAVALGESR